MRRLPLKFGWKTHLRFALLGLTMFSLHYPFIYYANAYLVSGVVAVLFSATSLFNIALSALLLRQRPARHVVFGALTGLLGLALFFSHDLTALTQWQGVALALTGTLIFSCGNIVSKKNAHLPLIPTTTWAMAYGAAITFCFTGTLSLPASPSYWAALLYLALPGSVLAFLLYNHLIARIGPSRAGYITVCFPLVALALSTALESYHWTLTDTAGLLLVALGNLLQANPFQIKS